MLALGAARCPFADRASSETDRAIELRARDRQRKLISKIESAIARIDEGSYGYCRDTGEPISLKILLRAFDSRESAHVSFGSCSLCTC